MKDFKFNRVWQVLYPVLVYFVLYQVARVAFRALLPEIFSDLFLNFKDCSVPAAFVATWYNIIEIGRAHV
mgnify:CR=1 FL=1